MAINFNILDRLIGQYVERFPNATFDNFKEYVRRNHPTQYRFLQGALKDVESTFNKIRPKQLPATQKGTSVVSTQQGGNKTPTASKNTQPRLTTTQSTRPQLTGEQYKLLGTLQERGASNKQIYDTLFNDAKDLESLLSKQESAILKDVRNTVKGWGSNIKNILKQGFSVANLVKSGVIGFALDQQLKSRTATQQEEEDAMRQWYTDRNLQAPTQPTVSSTPADQPTQVVNSTPQSSTDLPPAPSDSVENFIIKNTDPRPTIEELNISLDELPALNQSNVSQSIPSQGVVTGAAAPTNFQYQPYTPTMDYNMSQQEKELLDRFTDNQGIVSSREVLDTLRNDYNQMREQLIQDPRYQGDVVPAQGYNIDINEYNRRLNADAAANRISRAFGMGDTVNSAQDYINRQQQLYRASMANQAGVPYEDYRAAMLERQKADILARQQEVEAVLKLQAQQTTDMKEKMDLIQQLYKSRIEASKALDVANAQAFGDIQKQQLSNIGAADVANITQQGNLKKQYIANQGSADVANINTQGAIAKQREELSDPTTQMKTMGQFYSGMGYLPPNFQKGIIQNLSPQQQQVMFGTQFTPQQLGDVFNISQTPSSSETSQFNQFMSKIRGLQANEQ
ncbi:MAG: hypothetical protein NC218_08350 [Acetobacter sp.]|nr:hypothetical protein [Acetobacter sp.]